MSTSFTKDKDSVLFLGRDLNGEELWCSSSMVKTHMFVSGSTGSGKTEFLTNIMANVASWGSGAVFIDGKGDLAFFSKMHALMTAAGREEDLLLVNLSPTVASGHGKISSHTINPFAILSADEISLIMTGMLGRYHDPMWSGRAISLMNAIVHALVWLRDERGEPLTIGAIRSYLPLPQLIGLRNRLAEDKGTPAKVMEELRLYLETLPGYLEQKGDKQGATTSEQHGFLTMQWTRPVGMLATGYGHIFDAEVPDVDIRDVVLNRRVLVILLPSLDRSTDDIAHIGALLVGMLKSMLGQALRTSVEGSWGEVVRRRITNARYPFLMVMDEVGQYMTDGMGMMAQQARSLNVGLVFATQDFDSLYHRNSRETEAILANTNIKVFMKAENPGAMQIRNVLSSFVDRRRFENRKFEDILRAQKESVQHKLLFEPKVPQHHDFAVEMRPDPAWLKRMYELDAVGMRHYENAKPEDPALLLRTFCPGDMLVTYGSDIVVGRAGYVALDFRSGAEHNIRLPRYIKIAGYGQKEVAERVRAEEVDHVLKQMADGIESFTNPKGAPTNDVLHTVDPSRALIDPRIINTSNINKVWAEMIFLKFKRGDAVPMELQMKDCAYTRRIGAVAHAHANATSLSTGVKSYASPVVDVLKLFEGSI
jgi:Type IV secretion-system coupling protein DNA-binding domain.